MNDIILFDTPECHDNLLPLSFTRPVADFRVGITTIAEKWKAATGAARVLHAPVDYLRPKFAPEPLPDGEHLFIAGNVIPDAALVGAVGKLASGEGLVADGGSVVAFRGTAAGLDSRNFTPIIYKGDIVAVRYVFDIFRLNGGCITDDFRCITAGRESMPLPQSNTVIGKMTDDEGMPLLFIEEGADIQGATINLTKGPVYIGRDAEVMEGVCLRGPLAVCSNAHVNMGAKVYGNTTIGPFCKVGGEVNNIVMFGYSNKSHDGFLGNAVIGEWCNIGAGVNASNLKNDYSKIRIWNYASHSFMRTDLQFCGLIMGDHSKIGINCMLNTATVMGVAVNLHGAGFPRTFIPSFSEGSPAAGFSEVPMRKFFDIAERVMSRRGLSVGDADRKIFEAVREVAARLR